MSEQIETRPASSGHPTSWLERLWSSIADRGRDYANVPAASLPPGERARRLAAALLSGRGEASGAALARELVVALKALPPAGRLAFCQYVAAGFHFAADGPGTAITYSTSSSSVRIPCESATSRSCACPARSSAS